MNDYKSILSGAPCFIDDFIIDWLPAVLNEFVAGQAEAVCTNLGICSAAKEVSCHDCTKTLHNLADWLDSEEQVKFQCIVITLTNHQ